jgi:predicted Zn-dependent protease
MTRAALFLALIPCAALAQSDSRQQALGKKLAEDVESHSTLVNDPAVVQYVSRIAQNLAQAGEIHDPLTVKVITGDTAYAFPGASCYVNTGLILRAESEAELAGAIAHLLGHIVFWRTTPVEIGPGTQIPLISEAVCARLGGAFAIPMVFANGQATLEAQSDQAGLEYMAKAGYDPEGLADFFERILSGPKRRSSFYSWAKFPAATRTQADSLRDQRSDFIVTTSEFHDIQDRVASLTAKLTPPPGAAPTLNPVKHFH